MAKFHGKVGYAQTTETAPGVHDEVIIERDYYGDVVQNRSLFRDGDEVNPVTSVSNSISIVADTYAIDHFTVIRYVEWAGKLWTVQDVEVQTPRLLLRLGEVYNGITA